MTDEEGSHTADKLLLMQSGGPTTVINASLAGAIAAGQVAGCAAILGARNGVEGLLAGSLADLTTLAPERLARLRRTPSAALGTSRHRPSDAELEQIVVRCRALSITAIVAIGGNDTAETALRLADASGACVVTAPKTIDNDLPETDHCPGYGSIARYTALSVRDAAFDTLAMRQIYPIKLVEVMGRNAGWLAASGCLAFAEGPLRPLICLPERPFEGLDALAARVASKLDADGCAVLVVPETMKWADGEPVGGATPHFVDTFGHRYYPSPGLALAQALTETLGVRARFDKPGTLARMAMHAASTVDLAEAEACGREAAERALAGMTRVMVVIERVSDEPYAVRYGAAPLERVANIERCLPDAFITPDGASLTSAFTRYALPLLGEPLPDYEPPL